MTTPALTPADAFLIALYPAKVGVSLVDKALLERMPSNPQDDKLTVTLRSARASLANYEPWGNDAYQVLVDRATKAGLVLPARPKDADGYNSWTAAVRSLVRQAAIATADPSTLASFEAGAAAGDLKLAMETGEYLASLRIAVPEHAFFRQQAVKIAIELVDATQKLAAGLRHPAIPRTVARPAGKLLALFEHVPELVEATTEKSRLEFQDWMRKVGHEIGELTPAIRFPPEPPMTGSFSTEELALLAEIVANPQDNAPRLRFAELAAKRNDPRADMIQAQFAILELRQKNALKGHEVKHSQRATALASFHPEWAEAVVRLGAKSVRYYRGFIGFVEIDTSDFLRNAAALFQAAPIEHLQLRKAAGRVGELAASPFFDRIRSLLVIEDGIGDADILALAASPHSRGLQFLDLRGNKLTNTAVEAIVASPNLAALVELNLRGNRCDVPAEMFWFSDTDSEWGPTDYGKTLEARYGRKSYFWAATEARPLDLEDMSPV